MSDFQQVTATEGLEGLTDGLPLHVAKAYTESFADLTARAEKHRSWLTGEPELDLEGEGEPDEQEHHGDRKLAVTLGVMFGLSVCFLAFSIYTVLATVL